MGRIISDTFIMDLINIQPSQLFISEVKLNKVEQYLDLVDLASLDPLPVKKIGETVFFTDGHTRAFALWRQGIREVEVYWDEDDLNWYQYLICLHWCRQEGIWSIGHLHDRILPQGEYEIQWLERCKIMQDRTSNEPLVYSRIQVVEDPQMKTVICDRILRSLPQWFGIEEAVQHYSAAVREQLFLTVLVGEIPVGFVSVKDHNPYTSELYVLGIYQECHGRGLGRSMIGAVEERLLQQGKKFLTVKTLGDSHPDPYYKKTKGFYQALGYYPLEELDEIWGKENPCLVMAKPLM